jgi:hypothetical protein
MCVHHYRDFQELLREQPMHSDNVYDLVGCCITMLCDMAESQTVVELFSKQEVELVRLLLRFLTVCMLGPCPANQIKIAKSDVAIALNSIIPAKSEMEQEMFEKDSKFISMQALSLKVLAACLEARTDHECHKALLAHVDVKMLCESAVAIDSDVCVCVCVFFGRFSLYSLFLLPPALFSFFFFNRFFFALFFFCIVIPLFFFLSFFCLETPAVSMSINK